MKTNRIFSALLFFLTVVLFSSCLNHDLEELPTYDGNDITSVVSVYHRYYSNTTIPVSNAKKVLQKQLQVTSSNIDKKNKTVSIQVKIPTNFPKEEVDKVNKNNLVVILGISTAAIIAPAPDAPKLGVPGDWSKPNKYVVTAANKSMAEWTVTLTLDK